MRTRQGCPSGRLFAIILGTLNFYAQIPAGKEVFHEDMDDYLETV